MRPTEEAIRRHQARIDALRAKLSWRRMSRAEYWRWVARRPDPQGGHA